VVAGAPTGGASTPLDKAGPPPAAAEQKAIKDGEQAAGAEAKADDSCPTVQEAYLKFKGDMRRLEDLQANAVKRAKKAEETAAQEKQAVEQCLAAQKMLKGPEADAPAELEREVEKQVAKVKEEHEIQMQKVKADWERKLDAAVQAEKDRQDERSESQIKLVRLAGATKQATWKRKYDNLNSDLNAMKATHKLAVVRLETALKSAQEGAMSGMAGAQRVRDADVSEAQQMRKINSNNKEALQLVQAQLKAKTKEADSCAKSCGRKKTTFVDDPDQPCPTRMAHLLDQVQEVKSNNKQFEDRALAGDQRLVRTRVELKSALEHVEDLKKELASVKKHYENRQRSQSLSGMSSKQQVIPMQSSGTGANATVAVVKSKAEPAEIE